MLDRTARRRLATAFVVGCWCVCYAGDSLLAAVTCKPMLSFRNVREIRSSPPIPMYPYTWKATIVVNTNFCATTSGSFEIDFVRIKENSTDLQYTERFRWTPGQFDVSFELAADESILEYRIGFIAPCVCRDFPDIE
jgi:hypothetical protein